MARSSGPSNTPRKPARRGAAARPGTTSRPGTAARPSTPARPSAPARPGAKAGGKARPAATPAASRSVPARSAGERRASRSLKRILVLASIFVLLAITLVPTLRSYLRQQGEIDALRERVAGQKVTVEELQKEQARWHDNAYVEQQARERLKFVKVGDRSYTVIDGAPAHDQDAGVAAAPASSKNHPWYGQLWESARIADTRPATPAKAPAPAPAPKK